jgi:hypothetical protein
MVSEGRRYLSRRAWSATGGVLRVWSPRWDGEELLVQDVSYEGHPSWMQSQPVRQLDRESASLPVIDYGRRVVLSEARIVTAVAKDGRPILRATCQYEFMGGGTEPIENVGVQAHYFHPGLRPQREGLYVRKTALQPGGQVSVCTINSVGDREEVPIVFLGGMPWHLAELEGLELGGNLESSQVVYRMFDTPAARQRDCRQEKVLRRAGSAHSSASGADSKTCLLSFILPPNWVIRRAGRGSCRRSLSGVYVNSYWAWQKGMAERPPAPHKIDSRGTSYVTTIVTCLCGG